MVRKWIKVKLVGDRVEHFLTGRTGEVRFASDDGYIVIKFDDYNKQGLYDARQEWRRSSAFVLVETPVTTGSGGNATGFPGI